ncbi:calcium-binding and coiled-coil domain-containing protein 1-like [Diretmus argenteus]
MEKESRVVFRNVGQLYFPQTRVECHYSLTSDHPWTSKDWIGLFEVGWSSVTDYHTYTWALVPEGYTKGTNVNCCALFHAFYLPRPSPVEYQFVYVNEKGEVCARSRNFTFCAPKPLDELETMKEDRGEEEEEAEDGEEELLLVIPRAQLLQSRLEVCLKEQADLKQALKMAKGEKEVDEKSRTEARREWEHEREAMAKEISELTENLRHNCETLKKMEGKHKVLKGTLGHFTRLARDVKYTQESLSTELSDLLAVKSESQQRIGDLEDDIKVLTDRTNETNTELERMKERAKKLSNQMKHEDEKRKSLQAENEAALAEVRALQERLESSEHVAEKLRRELRELGTQQGHTHTELHQARLQVARLTLQLSEEHLALKEERANWALEREAYKQTAEIDKKKLQELSCEVQRKEEWLQEERMEREKLEVELGRERDGNRVLLSDAKREVQELRASQRKEREQQRLEKQGETGPNLEPRAGEGKLLLLPEVINPILSELADSPLW